MRRRLFGPLYGMLCAVVATWARTASAQGIQTDSLAVVRNELVAQYGAWGKAQVAADRTALERMLAADFEMRIGDRRMSRAEFLAQAAGASVRNRGSQDAGPKTLRFDTQILTLLPSSEGWLAVITEKIESEARLPNGEPRRAYTLGITRDTWRKDGERWVMTRTESVGTQTWLERPPFGDWRLF